MPTLTIDDRTIAAAEGATILDAARSSGIEIPTLCWYPRLPNVASCRVCLVSVQGSGKMLPACATPAAEGMVVRTQSAEAVDNRRSVLGMLLERYPVDRIPSNGGGNEFERMVKAHGVEPRHRAGLPLRTGDEREGDPVIRHDMSSCILCTRCVRACEDIQVVGVLDVGHRGSHAEIVVGGWPYPLDVRARDAARPSSSCWRAPASCVRRPGC